MAIIKINITIRQGKETGYPFESKISQNIIKELKDFEIPNDLYFINFKAYLRDADLIDIEEYSCTHLLLLKDEREIPLDTTRCIRISEMGIINNAHIIIQRPIIKWYDD